MKFPGQTKDGVIDNLLRAYVSRPSNPHQACPDFDPDQANAYIERSLMGASRSRYEQHLSECATCRKNVVALARLAEADTTASGSPASEMPRSRWFDAASRVFGAMSQPQWAMAAAAVIVLAISLPLVLSRNWNRQDSPAERTVSENAQGFAPASPEASPKSRDAALPTTAVATPKQREIRDEKADEKSEVPAKNAPAPTVTSDAAAGVAAGADSSKKLAATQPVDEAQRKTEGQVSQGPPQGGAAPASQVAKNDSDQNRQQQPEKDSAQQVNENKTRADQESTQKEKAGKPEEAVAPPAPASEVGRERGGLRRSAPKLSLRDSSGEAVRVDEKKAGGKKFLFRDGAWTDKDFDPNKDLPVVTIIRDSNVYKEVLSKRAGLKAIMERFSAAERAIIVYKGTVYKLIPQQGDK